MAVAQSNRSGEHIEAPVPASNRAIVTAPVLSYPDAARLIAEHAGVVRASSGRRIERKDLLAAQGCVVAAHICADRDQPPFPRSTRDGFACRAADLDEGRSVAVTGQLRAGDPARTALLAPGEAIEIMTGAPVPPGADAVVMIEHVLRSPAGVITLATGRSLRPGENIVPTGSEARAGEIIVPAGTRLNPAHIAAAAACGAASVDTYARPRIAILATGDELVEVDGAPLQPHHIRNSNSYSLAAQVRAIGGEPQRLPIARDSREHLSVSIERALASADLLLLSGGVSMGQYDLVEEVLANFGAEFFFTGVLIQPGKPAVYGRLQNSGHASTHICFLGLPGNPVSTLVTFHLLAAPLVRALGGETETAPRFASATLTVEFRTRPGLTRFLPARIESTWDRVSVTPVAWQGSGDLAATARSNCFLVVPPDSEMLCAGSTVQVLLPS